MTLLTKPQNYANATPEPYWERGIYAMWGKIQHNKAKRHYAVIGKWQGKRRYFSQIPAGGKFWTCRIRAASFEPVEENCR